MSEKKATDYTNSAVNLCNPPELARLLNERERLKEREANTKTALHETTLYLELNSRQQDIADIDKLIREAIEEKGSYQDLEAHLYAIKQRRVSITYDPGLVREFFGPYAEAVIEEKVNNTKVTGLLIGKLIEQETTARCAKESESFAFIIKT